MKACDKDVSFKDCELEILRFAIDQATEQNQKINNSQEIRNIFKIVEEFIKNKKLILYGGIAINAILPKEDQFYNLDLELPDYDFFSSNALEDAKELADIYAKAGFSDVEAKVGVHSGTYKVFVNFIPVADITSLHPEIYKAIKNEAISIDNLLYTPQNYLRMSMYLELSRPAGDITRWEKVLKRLILLNKNYPLTEASCGEVKFQRNMESVKTKKDVDIIYDIIKDTFIKQDVVFFGGYAMSLFANYMPTHLSQPIRKMPDFDVLSVEPEKTAKILKTNLERKGIKNVKIIKKQGLGEVIAPHFMINVEKDTVAFIYEPIACHSYNMVKVFAHNVKIATIDTMLSFYLAFIYSNRDYYDINRILCLAHFLFKVQQHNRLQQKGVLKRFSINCFGHQETMAELRSEKAIKFEKLKSKKGTKEYDEHFLRYRPADKEKNKEQKDKVKSKNKSIKNKREKK